MTYYNDENLFTKYNKYDYEELKKDKRNNCTRCINYKTGECVLLKIRVCALYVCPHFKVEGE